MNASNNFTVVGIICKDAEVRNFEKSSLARFGVSIKTTEKKGGVEITSSSIQSFETHHHKNQPLLPQGRQAKGGDIQTKETCHKDGKGLPPTKTKPPFFEKVKQKEEEAASS